MYIGIHINNIFSLWNTMYLLLLIYADYSYAKITNLDEKF